MKRTELRRKTPLKKQSAKALASPGTKTGRMRRKSVKPKNVKRRASEFARCYGSKERVAFVKAQPCAVPWCRTSPCDNAHSENGGMGRKGDARTIAPLCRAHHREMHREGSIYHMPPGTRTVLVFHAVHFRGAAERTEAAWQSECARRSAGGGE